MSNTFYAKMASSNIRKNSRTYVPYLLSCSGMVALFYMIHALSLNSALENMFGSTYLITIMDMATAIVGIFAVLFLFYVNSFLVKRRQREFGIYNILGMEKKHVARVILYETLYSFVISVGAGLAIGVVLNKLMLLSLLKILHTGEVMGFELHAAAFQNTIIVFAAIFLVLLLNQIAKISLSDPAKLLSGSKAGEKEPKVKWLLVVIGVLSLGAGYAIALLTNNPLSALSLFFVAVILVIIGTYCLFTSGSIAMLKALRRNKRYYYKTNHFVSVSSMMYRMKQNAAGLASICILSTAVLVMISSTVCLYSGIDDIEHGRYPRDILIKSQTVDVKKTDEIRERAETVLAQKGYDAENEISYRFVSFAALHQNDGSYLIARSDDTPIDSYDRLEEIYVIPLADYNRLTGKEETLEKNEVLIYSNRTPFEGDTLKLTSKVNTQYFSVKKHLPDFCTENGSQLSLGIAYVSTVSSHFVVVKDEDVFSSITEHQKAIYGKNASDPETYYGFDLNAPDEAHIDVYNQLKTAFSEQKGTVFVDSRVDSRADFYSIYGGLMFLGLFLGLLFLFATTLIIYYKQISEGIDDRERFKILQQVGMSKKEVRSAIHSQVLTMFFLPLLTAGVHIAVAFPILSHLMKAMGFTNVALFGAYTVGTFLVFAVFYVIVYFLTSRVYYRMVTPTHAQSVNK